MLSPHLHIQLFGDFRLVDNDQPITSVDTPRLQALLVYLLLHRAAPQSRQHLAFTFWPDSTEAQARANLRQMLHYLRHALPTAHLFLQFEAKTVQWRAAAPFTLDVTEFERHLAQADSAARRKDAAALRAALEAAIALYQGDLFPACYDDWLLPEREQWREKFTKALEQLIHCLEEQRDYAAALLYAQRLLRHDPLHETTYCHLMRLHALNGDRANALRTYHTCVTVLQRELSVEPQPTTQELYARLINAEQPSAQASDVGLRTATPERLVGRQAEWEKLQTAWRLTVQRRAHFVFMAGEAGIGKSRLAEEMLHWASQQGLTTAYTRSYAAEGDLAYAPVIEWLRSEALQGALAHLDVVWRTEVARLLPELLTQQPTLPRPEPLTERWQRQRLFEALARVFLLAKQPLLLVLDDLQWCDQETLEWLHYLLRFDQQARLLVIGTARPEEIDDRHPLTTLLLHLRSNGQVTEFEMPRFTADEAKTLAAQVAQQAFDPQAITQLYKQTEGNPLFIVETVRAAFNQAGGAWGEKGENSPAQSSPATLLPPKVQAVIQTRLSRLSPTARGLAELAAVIGRAFTFAELAQASRENEESLVRGLDELWQRRIVREQGKTSYDFSHDRIREVAYHGISTIRRRQWHGRVAEALRQLYANDLDAVSAVLAAHYAQAGSLELAIHWYQRAAEVAARRFVYTAAVDYLDAALQQLLTLPPTADRTKQEVTLLLAKASYLVPVHGLVSPAKISLCQRIEAIVDQMTDERLRFLAKGELRGFYGVAGYMKEAYAQAEQLLALAHQQEDLFLYAVAYQGYSMVNLQVGQFANARQYWSKIEALFYEAFSAAQRLEYGSFTITMGYLALVLWLLGYPDQARRKMTAAMAQAEVEANPTEFSMLLFFAQLLYCHMGEAALVFAVWEKIDLLATRYAIWLTKFQSLAMQGWLLVAQGDFEQGTAQMHIEIDELKKIGHTMFQTHRMGLLIEAQLKAGQFTDAATTLAEAFAMAEQSGQRSWDAELYRLKGELLAATGKSNPEVTLAYEQAQQIARQQNAKSLELRATVCLCRRLQRQGKRSEARQMLAEIYTWFTEGFDTADLQAAKALLEELSV